MLPETCGLLGSNRIEWFPTGGIEFGSLAGLGAAGERQCVRPPLEDLAHDFKKTVEHLGEVLV